MGFLVRFGLLLILVQVGCSQGTGQRRERSPEPAPIPTLEQLAAEHPAEPCEIQEWEDGDTPTVVCGASKEPTVIRMIGIDTAESGFDDNSLKRAHRQVEQWGMTLDQVLACGKAATRRVLELCPAGSPVQVVGTERGKYGRRLAYVVCSEVNLNQRLVAEGLAGRYPYPGPPEKPTACPLP